jgi:hypothetical protein
MKDCPSFSHTISSYGKTPSENELDCATSFINEHHPTRRQPEHISGRNLAVSPNHPHAPDRSSSKTGGTVLVDTIQEEE